MARKRPHASIPDEEWHEEAEKLGDQLMDIANEPQRERERALRRDAHDTPADDPAGATGRRANASAARGSARPPSR